MYKHILLPTDGSPLSARTVAEGVKLAKALGASLTALHVTPPPRPVMFKGKVSAGYAPLAERKRQLESAADKALAAVQKAAKAAGVTCKVESIVDDFPAETIVAVAKKRRCDLIMMASHGRRGI